MTRRATLTEQADHDRDLRKHEGDQNGTAKVILIGVVGTQAAFTDWASRERLMSLSGSKALARGWKAIRLSSEGDVSLHSPSYKV